MTPSLLALFVPLALEAAIANGPAAEANASAGEAASPQQQVRIEERVVIRIAPAGRVRALADTAAPDDDPSRYRERKVGKCLPLSGISGVRIGSRDRLLLLMHDRRVIGAELDKACRARDFYSGFYVERSRDGRLCVGRDMLLARSGASCSVSRLRELIEPDE